MCIAIYSIYTIKCYTLYIKKMFKTSKPQTKTKVLHLKRNIKFPAGDVEHGMPSVLYGTEKTDYVWTSIS